MYWCIGSGETWHAVLGDFDPDGLPEPEDARPDHVRRGRSAQRVCDQKLVEYKRVLFGEADCEECKRIKALVVAVTAEQDAQRVEEAEAVEAAELLNGVLQEEV